MNSTTVFCSLGANRVTNGLSASSNDTVAFCASNLVALYSAKVKEYIPNENPRSVVTALHGHKEQVNCLTFVRVEEENELLISASIDGECIVWHKKEDFWGNSVSLKGQSCITAVAALFCPILKRTLVVTCEMNQKVCVWEVNNASEPIFTISLTNKYALAAAMTFLPNTKSPLLAIACTDCKIHLYACEKENEFKLCVSLSGHENWTRSLDFVTVLGNNNVEKVFLASGNQDKYIRIYSLQSTTNGIVDGEGSSDLGKVQLFKHCGSEYKAAVDALLIGHDDWVYSVKWRKQNELFRETLTLLSASSDKTIIVWQPDKVTGVWNASNVLGNICNNIAHGFFSAVFLSDGSTVVGQSYTGALVLWSQDKQTAEWPAKIGVSGCLGPIRGIDWSPDDSYAIAVSQDQTARLISYWPNPADGTESWHELARPQIHGFDLQCLTFISPTRYASGGDEKIIRIFEAPKLFIQLLSSLQERNREETEKLLEQCSTLGANVPALGLSNKAVMDFDENENETFIDKSFLSQAKTERTQPPLESELINGTLWPEIAKLYGHVYEVYALACSRDQKILASASRSTSAEYAKIILWDSKECTQIQQLDGHNLTVTCISFSPDDQYILSGSRDRHFCIHKRDENGKYSLIHSNSSAHQRIIWSVSWYSQSTFATASRDKKVCIWSIEDESSNVKLISSLELSASVNSIAAIRQHDSQRIIFAVGLESGLIQILEHFDGEVLKLIHSFKAHGGTVNALSWNSTRRLLASAGDDSLILLTQLSFI